MKTNRKIYLFAMVVVIMIAVGCAGSFAKQAKNTLDFQESLYISAKEVANQLPESTWTPERKAEIEKVAKRYRIAWHAALETLIAYKETQGKAGMDLVNSAIDQVKNIVTEFNNLINKWGGE